MVASVVSVIFACGNAVVSRKADIELLPCLRKGLCLYIGLTLITYCIGINAFIA